MSEKKEARNLDRRDFFRKAGLGAGAIGAAVAMSGQPAKAAEAEKPKGAGYQESAHVKKYYELSRF